ncbi:MAG TPA: hypothetical protein VGM19_13105 [Armatimonadota bacterium]|jgi:hypothetical protein
MFRMKLIAAVVIVLVVGSLSVWADDAGGAAPGTNTPTLAAQAAQETLVRALTAVQAGDVATLEQCLAETVAGVGVNAQGEAPRSMILSRDELIKGLQQNAGQANLFTGSKLVDLTAEAAPGGQLVMVTYHLQKADDAEAKPAGPYWALVGKPDGQWRLMAFTFPR